MQSQRSAQSRKSQNPGLSRAQLKQQLQRQAQFLLKQRAQLQNYQNTYPQLRSQPVASQYSIIQQPQLAYQQISQTGRSHFDGEQPEPISARNSANLSTIRSKIMQVISLCNTHTDFRQIAQAQQNLLRNIDKENTTKPRSTVFQRKSSKSNIDHEAGKSMRSSPKKSKRESQKSILRNKMENKGLYISDQIMQLIQDIQNKAFQQIQKLRHDKVLIMKNLNQQIKLHNQEKNKCAQLYKRINILANQIKKRNKAAEKSQKQSYQNVNTIPQNLQETIQEQQTPQLQQIKYENNQEDMSKKYSPILRKNQQPQPQPQPQHSRNPSSNIEKLEKIPRQQFYKSQQHYSKPAQNYREQSKPSFPRIKTVTSQFQIQNEMTKLQNQNNRMKNYISQARSQRSASEINNLNAGATSKAYLRNQLRGLQQKAQSYSKLLNNIQNSRVVIDNSMGQFQNLLLQSNTLAFQGQNLMRVKSNPNLNTNRNLYQIAEQVQDQSPIRPTNTSIQYNQRINPWLLQSKNNKRNKNIEQRTSQYQNMIYHMQRATNS